MEKHWQYLIIFLISWIFFIIPNELLLKINPSENPESIKDTLYDKILFAVGLMGLMLMIIYYGQIKGLMDKTVKQNLNTFTNQILFKV